MTSTRLQLLKLPTFPLEEKEAGEPHNNNNSAPSTPPLKKKKEVDPACSTPPPAFDPPVLVPYSVLKPPKKIHSFSSEPQPQKENQGSNQEDASVVVKHNHKKRNFQTRTSSGLDKLRQNLQRGLAKAVGQRRFSPPQQPLKQPRVKSLEDQPEKENGTNTSSTSSSSSVSSSQQNDEEDQVVLVCTLDEAVAEWYQSLQQVWNSREMATLGYQTVVLTCSLQRVLVETALLPVALIAQAAEQGPRQHAAQEPCARATQWLVHATMQLASDVLSLAVPMPQRRRQRQLQKDPDWKDKLKLLSRQEEQALEQEQKAILLLQKRPSSKFLMRVGDLAVIMEVAVHPEETNTPQVSKPCERRVLFIDLNPPEESSESLDQVLMKDSLDRLITVGLGLLSSHPTVRLRHPDYTTQSQIDSKRIDWKCEAGTTKLLRRMVQQTTLERLQTMQTTDALIWSGRFQDKSISGYGSQFPFYLARGMIPLPPMELLKLLWDNERTGEYNRHCLGRKTLVELQPDTISTNGQGTKAIESETKVPFTSMTVRVQCLMHSRPLDGHHDRGYVLMSRSLSQGPAGVTYQDEVPLDGPKKKSPSGAGNEILWGINVLRCVPGHANWTDLTSLSQVGYSLAVPQFLASQIAIRGVQEFYQTVRQQHPHSQPSNYR